MPLNALLVMAKEPAAGQTKTRLSPPLTPEEAADLYGCMLRDTLDAVREAAQAKALTPFIAYYPEEAKQFFRELAPDFQLVLQRGKSLAERLENVLSAVQAQGYDRVVAINSDSPSLPAAYLVRAFEELDDPINDAVFGPTDDGGYYLIGWKRPYPRLLREVTMSTTHVLDDTLAIARQERIEVAVLPAWYDIDEVADLERLRADEDAGAHTTAFFSS